MKRYWSVRAHLLALMLAIFVPFGGVLAYLVLAEAHQSAQRSRDNALTLAQVVAENVQREILDARQLLVRLASQARARSMDPTRRAPIFDTFLESFPQFISFFKVNRAGQVLQSALPPPAGEALPVTDAPWFQEAMHTTNFLVTEATADPVTGQMVALLVSPIRTPVRGLTGALCAGLDLVRLQEILGQVSLPPESVITIVDHQGTVVARSDAAAQWVGKRVANPDILQPIADQPEGQFTARDLDQRERLYGFAFVPAANWRVLVGISSAVAFAPVRASALRSGALAFGLMGLATALALHLGARLSRPVRHLADALTRTGDQPLTAQLPVTGPRELAELATAFNTTAVARLQAEHRFRALAERSLTGIYIIQGRQFAYVNPCMAKLFGYATAAEVIRTKTALELVAPEDRRLVAANIQRRLEGEVESLHYTFRGLRLDGTRIDVEAYGSRTELDGQPVIIGTLLDVTARQRAQTALEQSERRYRELYSSMMDGFVRVRMDGRIVECNSAYVQMLGYPEAELLQLAEKDLTPEKWHAFEARIVEQQIRQRGFSEPYEKEYRRKDGTIFPVELRTYLLTDDPGQPTGMWAIVRDATARKQAEAERARLAEILEATSDFVVTATADGHPIFLNRAGRRAMGMGEHEDVSATHVGDYHPAWVTDRLFHEAMPVAKRDGLWSGEVLWRTRDGWDIPTIQVLVPHKSPDGAIQYFSGVARDITQLKAAECAVRDASARLLHVQEEEQQNIARELHDTTGQNLVALHMQLQTLQRLMAPADPAAGAALAEALRLAHESTQQLRTFAYLLHPPVLDDLGLQGAVRDYATGFEQRSGVQVECDLNGAQGPLPKEMELALFRVVQESLINIHRHSGSSTAAIRLWQESGELWLEIADAGCGMGAEEVEAASHPSSRLGVGIPGMRERIRSHGGRLEVRSSGRGTTVQAIVPLPPLPSAG